MKLQADTSELRAQFWQCLLDPKIEDVCLATQSGLLFHKFGRWHLGTRSTLATMESFTRDIAHLIAETAGVTLCARHPSLDTQLDSFAGMSSFRAHVVIPPLSGSGTQITLRRIHSAQEPLPLSSFGFTPQDLITVRAAVKNRQSILIGGATGAGKTSLLRALLCECDPQERIAILEDSAEISAPTAMSFCLRSRQNRFDAVEGATWNLEQLVYESLRMRPDRIVLGECRGPEALGLLHAMQSGHRGVICTIHASTPHQAIERYENLIALATTNRVKLDSAQWEVVIVMDIDANHQRRATVRVTEGI